MINGITKEEHIALLQECGMCTKKRTIAKIKKYEELRHPLLKIKEDYYKKHPKERRGKK